jgi:hypothetical protein
MENVTAAGEARTQDTGGAELLKRFCENGFDGSVERAALVLGREAEELQNMISGELEVDEDLEMKIRGIAAERGFDIDR